MMKDLSAAGVEGRRERRRVVVSPGVRSAERTSPMGSEVSEVSGEEGLFVSIDTVAESSRGFGAGCAWFRGGTVSLCFGVVGRQEVRNRKIEDTKKQKKVLQIETGRIFIDD
jgi:hypothetical protein